MRLRFYFVAALALALLSSCSPKKGREVAVPYVREIIQDKDNRFHGLISKTSNPDPQGEILVIGSERTVTLMVETLSTVDVRDNVDGSYRPDGLPDFAGETISCIIDTTGRPEALLLRPDAEEDRSENFRKYLLNGFLNAVDTIYHVTPYDLEGLGRRHPAKLIVSADPSLTNLVRHDIDTLFNALGSKVRVIAPSDEIAEVIVNSRANRDVVVSVMHNPDFTESGAYEKRFMKTASTKGSYGSSVSSFPTPQNVENVFTAYLDEYIEAGFTRPIDVIAVADFRADMERLKSEYAWLLSVMNEESAKYSKYLSKDFRIISSLETTVNRCYDILRTDNLFTHNITNPQVTVYYHWPDPQDSNVSFLVPSLYVQN